MSLPYPVSRRIEDPVSPLSKGLYVAYVPFSISLVSTPEPDLPLWLSSPAGLPDKPHVSSSQATSGTPHEEMQHTGELGDGM